MEERGRGGMGSIYGGLFRGKNLDCQGGGGGVVSPD